MTLTEVSRVHFVTLFTEVTGSNPVGPSTIGSSRLWDEGKQSKKYKSLRLARITDVRRQQQQQLMMIPVEFLIKIKMKVNPFSRERGRRGERERETFRVFYL